jgi:uncharacterized protein
MFRRRKKLGALKRIRQFLWPKTGMRRSALYLRHRVARLQGSPHAIATGFACGVGVSMTPFIGLHIALALALAWALRANVIAAFVGTFIANPWSFPLIWLVSYQLGDVLLGEVGGGEAQAAEQLDLGYILAHPGAVLLPMLAGGTALGVGLAAVAYLVGKPLARFYQRRRQERRRQGLARRLASAEALPGSSAGSIKGRS